MRGMQFVGLMIIAILSASGPAAYADNATDLAMVVPKVVLSNVSFSVSVSNEKDGAIQGGIVLRAGNETYKGEKGDNQFVFADVLLPRGEQTLSLISLAGETLTTQEISVLPGWLSLLPSLLAIVFALLMRQVIPALLFGLWGGAVLTYGLSLKGLWFGFFDIGPIYVLQALTDSGHMSIIIFSLLIGGLVGIISKNGGMNGIVRIVASFANSAKRGQVSTALLGTIIFFDDYANTMVVGNTMRAVTDRLKISREKLAYIVDSTAAPVASLAVITTWIGFQVGLIDQSIKDIPEITESAYSIFLHSIPYGFYSIFAILFVYLVALTGRDFGPMKKAEAKARNQSEDLPQDFQDLAETESTLPDRDLKGRAMNAVIPLIVLIAGTFAGICVTGYDAGATQQSLQDIIGNGDAYVAMIWASGSAVFIAATMTMAQRILSLADTMDAFISGLKSLVFAIVVLTLAWSLAEVNGVIQTANYLSSILADSLSPPFLPLTIFLLSALMAFATGSSWGVMGIMVPLVVPLTWAVLSGAIDAGETLPLYIFYSSIAALLSGAVWGDHCSPISDTTILSSMASGCNHIEHVRTQLPYAVVVAVVAIIAGSLPSGFGFPAWISLVLGLGLMIGTLLLLGKRTSPDGDG